MTKPVLVVAAATATRERADYPPPAAKLDLCPPVPVRKRRIADHHHVKRGPRAETRQEIWVPLGEASRLLTGCH